MENKAAMRIALKRPHIFEACVEYTSVLKSLMMLNKSYWTSINNHKTTTIVGVCINTCNFVSSCEFIIQDNEISGNIFDILFNKTTELNEIIDYLPLHWTVESQTFEVSIKFGKNVDPVNSNFIISRMINRIFSKITKLNELSITFINSNNRREEFKDTNYGKVAQKILFKLDCSRIKCVKLYTNGIQTQEYLLPQTLNKISLTEQLPKIVVSSLMNEDNSYWSKQCYNSYFNAINKSTSDLLKVELVLNNQNIFINRCSHFFNYKKSRGKIENIIGFGDGIGHQHNDFYNSTNSNNILAATSTRILEYYHGINCTFFRNIELLSLCHNWIEYAHFTRDFSSFSFLCNIKRFEIHIGNLVTNFCKEIKICASILCSMPSILKALSIRSDVPMGLSEMNENTGKAYPNLESLTFQYSEKVENSFQFYKIQ
uniref:Nicotinate phosphoribosyltransferase n=1 Tax=Rhabditophanes sp. KR3021 TaxID=114890 RepID=A0AC35UHP6_9BILA